MFPTRHPGTDTTRPRNRLGRRLAVTGLALALVTGVAACGDDDDSAASSSTTKGTSADAAALPAEACDAAVDLGASFSSFPQDPTQIGPFLEKELVPAAEVIADSLDGKAGKAGAALLAGYEEMAESGDPSTMEDEGFTEAQAAVGAAVHEGCDLEQVDIRAVEYAYEGVPEELEAGRVSFALENAGVEEHEIVLFRRNDDATESFEEISKLPEEEMMSKVSMTGVTFGGPGSTTYAALDLEPGTYFLVCFIPVGGQDGPPHFMQGMQHTLVVS